MARSGEAGILSQVCVRRRSVPFGEGVEGALVGAGCGMGSTSTVWVGLFGEPGGQQSFVDPGEQHRGAEALCR